MYIIHAFIHVHFRNNLFQATSKTKTSFIEKCFFSCSGRQILGPMVSAMADIELTQKKVLDDVAVCSQRLRKHVQPAPVVWAPLILGGDWNMNGL